MSGHRVFADVDAAVSYTNPAVSLTPHQLNPDFVGQQVDRLAFGVHDACWTLLLSRIAPGQEPTGDVAAAVAVHLYHVLWCLPGDRHRILNPAHDYGGAWRFSFFSQPQYDGELTEDEWSFLLADPLQMSIGDAPPQAWSTKPAIIRDANHYSDIFARLSHELIVAVLTELPSTDLCNLRLASRAVASVSSPASLPNSFWHSRFTSGFEMGFYMAGHLPELPSRDWRVLYGHIRDCLTRPSAHPALCNRRRIWHVLGDLVITLEALLEGSSVKQTCISHATLLPHRPGMAARAPRAPCQNPLYPSTSLAFVWDSEKESTQNSINNSTSIKISASFIHFDGRSFLCGIRATASTPAVTLSQAGLIRPITEQHFCLERGQEITKVRVICSAGGVVGTKFFIQTAGPENAGSGVWQSVGITDMSQADLGIAELVASGKILGLTLECDVSFLPYFAHTT